MVSCSDHKVVAITGRGGSDIAGGDGGEVPSTDGLCTGPVCDVWGDQGNGTYLNPVLWADYNTLDAIADGSDFYMISATHHFMGMPVLHSQDLVNWEIVSRVYRSLNIAAPLSSAALYDTPGLAYEDGSWGPTIRYNNGLFYVYVATPEEGLLLTTATAPAGPWAPMQLIRSVTGWQDPCPFWDDVDNAGGDGPNGRQAYLVRGAVRTVAFQGQGTLYLHKMSWDGTTVIGDGTVIAQGTTLQGPKLLKRNGYYYIFAPTGAASTGSEVVLRYQDISGVSPAYQQQTILEQGVTNISGTHLGAWLDLPNGDSWFLHNAALGGWGRVVHLEPARSKQARPSSWPMWRVLARWAPP